MARSWRNFFRRGPEEPQDQAPTAPETDVPAKDGGSGNGAGGALPEPAEPGYAGTAGPSVEDGDAAEPAPVEEPEVRLDESPEPAALEPDPMEPPVEEELEPEPAGVDLPAPTPIEEAPGAEAAAEEQEAAGWFGRLRRGLTRSRESFVGQLNAAVA